MTKYYTEGRILTIKPGSSYQRAVYDQNVTFELKNGMRLELFDHKMLITSDMTTTNKKILIGILDSEFSKKLRRKKVPTQEKKIIYDKGYDIHGEIVHKILNASYKVPMEDCIIDFGAGYMRLTTKVGEFKIGEFVYVHASRLDVDRLF